MSSSQVSASTNGSGSGSTGHKLAFAFEPHQGDSKAPTTASSALATDLRQFSLADRTMLAKGSPKVVFRSGSKIVAELPRPLFIAASTNPSIVLNGVVDLPKDVAQGVAVLINYIRGLGYAKHNLSMPVNSFTIHDMLTITAASKYLGMEKYTTHIYQVCEGQLRAGLPLYADLDSLTLFSKQHARLFHIVAADILATCIWEKTMPDPEDFNAYLAKNDLLQKKVKLALASIEKNSARQKERAESMAPVEEWRQKVAEDQANQVQEDSKFWKNKKKQDRDLEQACLEAVRTPVKDRKPFTAAQKSHWRKTRGGTLPTGC